MSGQPPPPPAELWIFLAVLATIGGVAAGAIHSEELGFKSPKSAIAVILLWPLTGPVFLWRELSDWLFPRCHECGKRVRPKARHCPTCGKPLAAKV